MVEDRVLVAVVTVFSGVMLMSAVREVWRHHYNEMKKEVGHVKKDFVAMERKVIKSIPGSKRR